MVGEAGTRENIVEDILSHRERGKQLHFLTLMKGAPCYETAWQPTEDFVDTDSTAT